MLLLMTLFMSSIFVDTLNRSIAYGYINLSE